MSTRKPCILQHTTHDTTRATRSCRHLGCGACSFYSGPWLRSGSRRRRWRWRRWLRWVRSTGSSERLRSRHKRPAAAVASRPPRWVTRRSSRILRRPRYLTVSRTNDSPVLRHCKHTPRHPSNARCRWLFSSPFTRPPLYMACNTLGNTVLSHTAPSRRICSTWHRPRPTRGRISRRGCR